MANQWIEDIKNELTKAGEIKPIPQTIPTVTAKAPVFDKYSQNLFLLALSLVILLAALYQDKTGQKIFDPQNWKVDVSFVSAWVSDVKEWFKKDEVIVPPPSQPEPKPIVVVNKDLDQVKIDLKKNKAAIKKYAEMQRLLAIISNNNAAAVRGGFPNEVILLNRDWTISKLPTLLFLDEEDIKFLSKFLVK